MRNLSLDLGDLIQAFPVHNRTQSGVFTNKNIVDYKILHADEDCIITVVFIDTTIVALNLLSGDDISFGDEATLLTTTGICKIS